MQVIVWLASRLGITQQAAKYGLIGIAVVSLIVGLGVAKCNYDKKLVSAHDAKVANKELTATIKANTKALDQRAEDQTRLGQEAAGLQRSIDNADKTNASAPRAAYYECVRRQQLARKQRQQPPAC